MGFNIRKELLTYSFVMNAEESIISRYFKSNPFETTTKNVKLS